MKKINKLLLIRSITSEKLEGIEETLPSIKSRVNKENLTIDMSQEFDFDEDFPLKNKKDLEEFEGKIRDKLTKMNLVTKNMILTEILNSTIHREKSLEIITWSCNANIARIAPTLLAWLLPGQKYPARKSSWIQLDPV